MEKEKVKVTKGPKYQCIQPCANGTIWSCSADSKIAEGTVFTEDKAFRCPWYAKPKVG